MRRVLARDRRDEPACGRDRCAQRVALWVALLALSGCLGGAELKDYEYACRAPSDCVSGYFCHPRRFVCVTIGTSTTTADAGGAIDAELIDAH